MGNMVQRWGRCLLLGVAACLVAGSALYAQDQTKEHSKALIDVKKEEPDKKGKIKSASGQGTTHVSRRDLRG